MTSRVSILALTPVGSEAILCDLNGEPSADEKSALTLIEVSHIAMYNLLIGSNCNFIRGSSLFLRENDGKGHSKTGIYMILWRNKSFGRESQCTVRTFFSM